MSAPAAAGAADGRDGGPSTWQSRQQLRLATITWIENTYHRRRRQNTLDRLTPIELETLQQAAHAA